MADLALKAGTMCDRIEFLTGSDASNEALAHLNRGYIRVLGGIDPRDPSGEAHVWSYLRPRTTIGLWATTTTAAVTVSTGSDTGDTLTVASATFYASMVGKSIVADTSSNSYTIISYTSSTVVVVGANATTDTGDTFTITANGIYQLPDDFGGVSGDLIYAYSSSVSMGTLEEIDLVGIEERYRDSDSTGMPSVWTVIPRSIVATGQRFDLFVHPIPEATRVVNYQYNVRATALTDSDSIYPIGSPKFHLAVEYAGMAEAEVFTADEPGIYHNTRYPEAMAAAIDEDKAGYGSGDIFLNMSDVV